jgi:hypothetical protein
MAFGPGSNFVILIASLDSLAHPAPSSINSALAPMTGTYPIRTVPGDGCARTWAASAKARAPRHWIRMRRVCMPAPNVAFARTRLEDPQGSWPVKGCGQNNVAAPIVSGHPQHCCRAHAVDMPDSPQGPYALDADSGPAHKRAAQISLTFSWNLVLSEQTLGCRASVAKPISDCSPIQGNLGPGEAPANSAEGPRPASKRLPSGKALGRSPGSRRPRFLGC